MRVLRQNGVLTRNNLYFGVQYNQMGDTCLLDVQTNKVLICLVISKIWIEMWVFITQDDAPVRKLNIVVISVKKLQEVLEFSPISLDLSSIYILWAIL